MDEPIDIKLVSLACAMAKCEPDHLLGAQWHDDALTVIVQPPAPAHGRAPKPRTEVFTAAQIADAVAGSMTVAIAAGLHPTPAPDWYEKNITPALARANEPAGQTRDSFQDAVRADPTMTPAQKERWLGTAEAPAVAPASRTGEEHLFGEAADDRLTIETETKVAAELEESDEIQTRIAARREEFGDPQVHRVETGKSDPRHRGKRT